MCSKSRGGEWGIQNLFLKFWVEIKEKNIQSENIEI
jgi:hypothetical protein